MTEMFFALRTWLRTNIPSERGASLVEYALLVLLIAILGFVAVQLAGGTLSDTYHDIASDLKDANAN